MTPGQGSCQVTWLTDPDSELLLRHNPLIDRLMTWSWESVFQLAAEPFWLALNFEKEPRALALMQRAWAKEKRGFAFSEAGTLGIANEASRYALELGLSDELKFKKNQKTYPQIIAEMAELPYRGDDYIFVPGERADSFGNAFAERRNLKKFRSVIGLNTGCGSVFATKQWTVENFCELIELLAAHDDIGILLLGGKREETFNRQIMQRVGKKTMDSGCENELEDFFGIVNCCDAVVSSDSLGMHLAIGLKKKVIALFGSTCAQEVDLFGRGEKVVTDFSCSPCYLQTCDKDPLCMEEMRGSTVYAALCRALDIAPQPSAKH